MITDKVVKLSLLFTKTFLGVLFLLQMLKHVLEQWSPTILAPGTDFMEDVFGGADYFGFHHPSLHFVVPHITSHQPGLGFWDPIYIGINI